MKHFAKANCAYVGGEQINDKYINLPCSKHRQSRTTQEYSGIKQQITIKNGDRVAISADPTGTNSHGKMPVFQFTEDALEPHHMKV